MQRITTVKGLNILEINDEYIPSNAVIYLKKDGTMIELGSLEELVNIPQFLGTSYLYDRNGVIWGDFRFDYYLTYSLYIQ
jgi:hypothetical protein